MADQDRVVDVHRVGVPRVVLGDHDLRAGILEDAAEQLVLASRSGMVGRRAPAVLLPACAVRGERRANEDSFELPCHRRATEGVHRGGRYTDVRQNTYG